MPSSTGQRTHTIAVLAALVATAGILAFLILRPGTEAQSPPGVIQPTEIKIAPEISGRLSRFVVVAGQGVQQGDILAELANPELEAALVLAKAQLGQERAERDRVYAGPRQEEIDSRQRAVEMAEANLLYARQQFFRASQLSATGFASRQDFEGRSCGWSSACQPLPRQRGIPSRPSRAYARGAYDFRCQGRECRGSRCRHCGARSKIAHSSAVSRDSSATRRGAGRGGHSGTADSD